MNDAAPRSRFVAVPLAVFDFGLRLVFFALAPAMIVGVWFVMPITGALVNVALALGVFFASEWVRGLSNKHGVLGKILKRQLMFEEYYRSRPPRPFAYYVFYPLLFPYWLFNKEARKEFLLFKGYTILSFVILLVTATLTFYRKWYPELHLHDYWRMLLTTLLVESAAVLTLMMPIATTVVTYHLHGAKRRLVILLAVGALSVAAVIAAIAQRRDPIVSYETRARLELRTIQMPKEAHDCQIKALEAAWKYVRKNPEVVQQDGKITGEALERARTILDDGIYKPDES